MRLAALPVVFVCLATAPALAQNCMMLANPCGKGTRVNVNFQLSAPAPATASAADFTKSLAGLSQSLYEIVDRECDVLGAALKGDCRLVQININSNINERMNNGAPAISANANAVFEIEPKPAAAEVAPK